METKVIDGKEYTKVAITELSINGENKDNSFSSNDLDNQGQISFDIKIDSNTDINPNSFVANSLNLKNSELNNNINISDNPIAETFVNTSKNTEYSTKNEDDSDDAKSNLVDDKKNSYWYYFALATALVALLYFIFIK